MIFKTKLVNDELYKRNGQKVELMKRDGIYMTIKFEDGTIAKVYSSEVREEE